MDSELLGSMINELVEAGIEVRIFNKKRMAAEGGGSISGGFSDEERTLEVAGKRDDWFLVFAHEYCHFKQWQEGVFDDVTIIAAYSVFDSWLLKHRELKPELLRKFIRSMQWLEWENEHRTVTLLDENEVDYDREDYIKKTNLYIYSYELCRRIRKWHKTPLYDVPELLELVSGDEIIDQREFGNLPEGFEALALPCYDFAEHSEHEEE